MTDRTNMFLCVIDNCCIGEWPLDGDSLNSEEALFCLDSLSGTMDRILRAKYGLTTQRQWMMFLLPHVARWFSRDRHDLLKEWVASHTPFLNPA